MLIEGGLVAVTVVASVLLCKYYHPPKRSYDGGYNEYAMVIEGLPYIAAASPAIWAIIRLMP